MEYNQTVISGQIIEIKKSRFSPSGVPHAEMVLEHRSRQDEEGKPRIVECQLLLQFTGEALNQQASVLEVGSKIVVEGFLLKKSQRQDQTVKLQVQRLRIE